MGSPHLQPGLGGRNVAVAQGLQTSFADGNSETRFRQALLLGRPQVVIDREERIASDPSFSRKAKTRKSRLRNGAQAHRARDTEVLQVMTSVKEDEIEPDLMLLAAHQLLSPLSMIDSAAQRMIHTADSMSPEDVRARAVRIRSTTARLSALVHKIMHRARLEHQVLDVQELDWRDLIYRAIDHIHCTQPTRCIIVEGMDVLAPFKGDALLLEQMLLILLCNAAKYSPLDSSIAVTGCVDADLVRISVKDNGIGIPKGDLSRIFQPFFRSRNATCLDGTGLGLNLAERIVRLHGGSIEVQSQEGRGSTFTIIMPQA
jgi:signal transduction histidine kinase